MWKSSCCIFFTILLALIGLSMDLLMSQKNMRDDHVEIKADWGFDEVNIRLSLIDLDKIYNYPITYDNAYNLYCVNNNIDYEQPNYCNDLNKINNGGAMYAFFGIFGILFLTFALIFSIIVTAGKSCCGCKCRLRLVVAGLVFISFICLLVSFAVFINSFSDNVDNLLSTIVQQHISLQLIQWEKIKIGHSIALIISAMSFSFLSLIMILFVDRDSDNILNKNNNQQLLRPSQQQSQQPVSSGITYYQPNGSVNNNGTNNGHSYGEPDYIVTPNYTQV